MPKRSETANCAKKFSEDAKVSVIGLRQFTPIPTRLLQDDRLTFEERGMLSCSLSLNEDWEVSAELGRKLQAFGYISDNGEFAW